MTRLQYTFAWLLLACVTLSHAADRIVVIGHPSLHKIDLITVQRIFTGKTIEVDGVRVRPANGTPNLVARQRFLSQYLQTDEDQYVAYWTVRRYVGKGTPPHEVKQTAEMIEFVSKTPGAIGYVDEADVLPGMNVVLRK